MNKLCKVRGVMPPVILQISSMLLLLLLPVSGSAAALGTRQRTITPVALTNPSPTIYPSAVSNNIIPQPSPYPDRPEYGFWEVETASLRDFPQEFRTFEILRNTDNSISIRVTDIDPEVTTNSPAAVSRGYAIGAARIFMTPCTFVTDTNSYAHNAELLKLLTPSMQAMIAGYGGPLGHNVAIDRIGAGVAINFLGELQSADTVLGPWSDVTDTSPYAVSATNGAPFYRACESDSSNATPKATDYSKTNHWLTVPATDRKSTR